MSRHNESATQAEEREARERGGMSREGFWWPGLPTATTWIQGACIRALGAVPMAVLTGALRLLRAAEGRKCTLQQALALVMSLLVAVPGIAAPTGSEGAQLSAAQITAPLQKANEELATVVAGTKEGTPPPREQVAARLEKLFQALEEAERQIPRDTFDSGAIIEKVGPDPAKLFKWVRDETYLVPYRGLLRGDKGVLMDRLGNSLDRALLLYALLRDAGHTVQLANGTLTQDQAIELLQKARPVPTGGIPALKASQDIPDDLLQKIAFQNPIDGTQLRKLITNVTAEQERMKEAVMRRVTEQASFIAAAVGKPKEDIRKKEEAAAIEALGDHWWVQLEQDSTWKDFDPSMPDAELGRALAVAEETLAPDTLSDLREDLLHTVQIQVVVEVWKQGQVTEVPVLTQTLIPAALIGQAIALRHVPVAWPEDLNLFAEKDPVERLKTTVLAQKEWVAIITVGSTNVFKNSFNDRGDLGDATLPGYIQNVLAGRELVHSMEEGVGGLGKQLQVMLGQPKAEEPKRQPPEGAAGQQLTAEWIDYEIRVPGQPVRKIRRQIFDLIGPAARLGTKVGAPEITEPRRLERGLTLLGETEILLLTSQLSPEFVQHLTTKNMLANRDALLGLLRLADSEDFKGLTDLASKLEPISFQLHDLAVARREWGRFRGDVYMNRPNIISYHKYFRRNTEGKLLSRQGFDIVANDVAVRPGLESFLVRLEQGVLDTNSEALLMGPGINVENTAEILAKGSGGSMEWLTIRSVRDQVLQGLSLPVDVRARIEQDLASRHVTLVPKKLPSLDDAGVGWWRIDPETGQTLGIMETGWGQTAVEYWLKNIYTLAVVGCTLRCMWVHMRGLGAEPSWRLPRTQEDIDIIDEYRYTGGTPPWPLEMKDFYHNVRMIAVCSVLGAIPLYFPPTGTWNLFWKTVALGLAQRAL